MISQRQFLEWYTDTFFVQPGLLFRRENVVFIEKGQGWNWCGGKARAMMAALFILCTFLCTTYG